MSDYRGAFVWYDLMTTDPEGAQSFYKGLIDWGTQAWDGPMPYTMWTVGEKPVGGLMQLPEEAQKAGAPPHWIAYVGTDDVEGTLKKVVDLGGMVHVPATEIPNTGKFGIFADPQGAVMALYTPANTDSDDYKPSDKPGRISWHEMMAADLDGAWNFYEKLFGWNKTDAMDMGEHGTYQMYGQGEASYGGMMTKPAEIPGPAFWMYYINVADIDGTIEKVKSTGGQVMNGPMEVPGGGKVAQCTDPQGAAFALYCAP